MHTLAKATNGRIGLYDALITRSKSVWEWPDGYLAGALPLLRINSEYLGRSASYEIRSDGVLVGFCAIVAGNDCPILDHLWIEPHHIGHGAGRFAIGRLSERATREGESAIDVWPDPPAEQFYVRLGFKDSGDLAPSRVAGGPVFRRFRMALPRGAE